MNDSALPASVQFWNFCVAAVIAMMLRSMTDDVAPWREKHVMVPRATVCHRVAGSQPLDNGFGDFPPSLLSLSFSLRKIDKTTRFFVAALAIFT
jgi:hypothetical protein